MVQDGKGRVLVVEDGESRIALGAARALRTAGWTVGVASPVPSHASTSRASSRLHRVPLPNEHPAAFVDEVRAAVRDGGYDVALGVGDAEILSLSAAREQLGALVPYPSHDVVLRLVDKTRMAAHAEAVGLATPPVVDVDSLGSWTGPLVVKPQINGQVGHVGTSKIAAVRVTGGAEALEAVERVRALGGRPLVQQAVAGDLMALVLLLAPDGRTAAVCQQRASHVHPLGAGVSARARTEPVDEELAGRGADFLRRLGWWGVAELQLLAAPGRPPVLIDVNARLYGSMSLAVAAGVNLPDLWLRLAAGDDVGPLVQARPGVRYQWLEGDLRRAVQQRSGGLLRDLAGCLRAATTSHHSTWSPADPLPAARQVVRLALRASRKLRS